GRCRAATERVDHLPLPELGPFGAAVTSPDSCHLRNVQGVADPPRRLLRRVPGLRYVELPGAAQCCGAGGVYTLTQPAMSRELLDAKKIGRAHVGASVLAVANTPCH